MSLKTDELVASLPDAYAADDTDSLVYLLLDAIGAELMIADASVKRMLKSHWVDYAEGAGLDGLGATFGVARRQRHSGELEDDELFRRRLKSVVRLFTGGGTAEAVKGAVRSALGLPFHLGLQNLPEALRKDLERLVDLKDFSPTPERLLFPKPGLSGDVAELVFDVDVRSAEEASPRIVWTFVGSARMLTVERLAGGGGVRSKPEFVISPGKQLILTTTPSGAFSAVVGATDVSSAFTSLDGGGPPVLPVMTREPSSWRLRAKGSLFDWSTFDEETFDLPSFKVELTWTRAQPLTFDVFVPYFLGKAVDAVAELHDYKRNDLFVFKGLPVEVIQQVVDESRAAGVRGNVHFSLRFDEDHAARELPVRLDGIRKLEENHGMADALTVGSLNSATENHSAQERFWLAAEFDVATYDGPFGMV